jgi:hypothetical protein
MGKIDTLSFRDKVRNCASSTSMGLLMCRIHAQHLSRQSVASGTKSNSLHSRQAT